MNNKARLKALETRTQARHHVTLCNAGGQYWQPVKADFSDVLHGLDLFGNPCAPQLVKVLTLDQVEALRRTHDVFVIRWFPYAGDGRRDDLAELSP